MYNQKKKNKEVMYDFVTINTKEERKRLLDFVYQYGYKSFGDEIDDDAPLQTLAFSVNPEDKTYGYCGAMIIPMKSKSGVKTYSVDEFIEMKTKKALELGWLFERIQKAHKDSLSNYELIKNDKKCGCFNCLKIFSPKEIVDCIDDKNGPTPECPYCYIDSVLGESNGYPITIEFLQVMHDYWFDSYIPIDEDILNKPFDEEEINSLACDLALANDLSVEKILKMYASGRLTDEDFRQRRELNINKAMYIKQYI